MVMRFCQFHGMSLIQTSFIRDHSHKFHLVSSLHLCQSFSCDILCLDRLSLSSKWPWTRSNSLLLPRVRFDINALSLNIQISRSCSNWLCLNLPHEFRYCNGRQFEFPSWINKPLFMDIWDTKQRVLSLNLISFSWYVYLNRFQSKESLLGLIMKEHKIGKLHEASVQRFC